MITSLALLVAAACPVGWVGALFYDNRGRLKLPEEGSSPVGLTLMGLVTWLITLVIGIVAMMSLRRPEIRELSLTLLGVLLLAIAFLSSISMALAPSKLAKSGVWYGGIGLLAFLVVLATER